MEFIGKYVSIMGEFTIDNYVFEFTLIIITAVITLLSKYIYDFLKMRKGPFSGKWRNTIPKHSDQPEKIDSMKIKQKGSEISAVITRKSPKNDRMTWKASGTIRGRDFFAVFLEPSDAGTSYGAWFVHQVNRDKFEGIYIRRQKDSATSLVEQIPIVMEREP